jgi:hypothetical protein
MQTVVQVVCTRGQSLRTAIIKDTHLTDFGFQVITEKKLRRAPGWAKIRSFTENRRGAINLAWDKDAAILLGRVVSRGKKSPSLLVGDFVEYLLCSRKKRIVAINILPR